MSEKNERKAFSRRDFLKIAALVGAAVIFLPKEAQVVEALDFLSQVEGEHEVPVDVTTTIFGSDAELRQTVVGYSAEDAAFMTEQLTTWSSLGVSPQKFVQFDLSEAVPTAAATTVLEGLTQHVADRCAHGDPRRDTPGIKELLEALGKNPEQVILFLKDKVSHWAVQYVRQQQCDIRRITAIAILVKVAEETIGVFVRNPFFMRTGANPGTAFRTDLKSFTNTTRAYTGVQEGEMPNDVLEVFTKLLNAECNSVPDAAQPAVQSVPQPADNPSEQEVVVPVDSEVFTLPEAPSISSETSSVYTWLAGLLAAVAAGGVFLKQKSH